MITANQAARLKTAGKLYEARSILAETVSSICWEPEQSREISAVIARIDQLFSDVIPNGGKS